MGLSTPQAQGWGGGTALVCAQMPPCPMAPAGGGPCLYHPSVSYKRFGVEGQQESNLRQAFRLGDKPAPKPSTPAAHPPPPTGSGLQQEAPPAQHRPDGASGWEPGAWLPESRPNSLQCPKPGPQLAAPRSPQGHPQTSQCLVETPALLLPQAKDPSTRGLAGASQGTQLALEWASPLQRAPAVRSTGWWSRLPGGSQAPRRPHQATPHPQKVRSRPRRTGHQLLWWGRGGRGLSTFGTSWASLAQSQTPRWEAAAGTDRR